MKKELLTVKELAAELRVSPKSIQRAYRSPCSGWGLTEGWVVWFIWFVSFVWFVWLAGPESQPEELDRPEERERPDTLLGRCVGSHVYLNSCADCFFGCL
jgi:hypothetical protein